MIRLRLKETIQLICTTINSHAPYKFCVDLKKKKKDEKCISFKHMKFCAMSKNVKEVFMKNRTMDRKRWDEKNLGVGSAQYKSSKMLPYDFWVIIRDINSCTPCLVKKKKKRYRYITTDKNSFLFWVFQI